jgi:ABC-type phosphate transport system ATPase subunit
MIAPDAGPFAIETRGLNLWYGKFQALIDITVGIRHGLITSLIGPSGCGKTTLLRCFNRVNERYPEVRTTGEIQVLGRNIYDPDVSLVELRRSVGMVFQRPNPLPLPKTFVMFRSVIPVTHHLGKRSFRHRDTEATEKNLPSTKRSHAVLRVSVSLWFKEAHASPRAGTSTSRLPFACIGDTSPDCSICSSSRAARL